MNTKSNESSVTTNRDHVVDGSELTLEVFSPRVVQPKKFFLVEVASSWRSGRRGCESL